MSPFLDEVAKPDLVPSRDLAHEVLGQLQIALRTGQSNMPKVGGQKWQFRAEVDILFAPQQEPEDSK